MNDKKFSCKIKRGSITAEAALAFPIFFFFFVILLGFFQVMLIRMEVQNAVFKTASFLSQYAYFEEAFSGQKNTEKETIAYEGKISDFMEGVLDNALIKIKFDSLVNKNLINHSFVVNGISGISFWKSSVMEEGNDIEISADYKIKFPCPFFELPVFKVVQKAKTKAYLGKSMQEQKDGSQQGSKDTEDTVTVYVTKTGSVYHKTKECTYLNPEVREIMFSGLENVRNQNGGKYTACEYCCRKAKEYQSVYIAAWGTSYHSLLSCSRLKRTVTEISLKKAEQNGYKACSKCGQ